MALLFTLSREFERAVPKIQISTFGSRKGIGLFTEDGDLDESQTLFLDPRYPPQVDPSLKEVEWAYYDAASDLLRHPIYSSTKSRIVLIRQVLFYRAEQGKYCKTIRFTKRKYDDSPRDVIICLEAGTTLAVRFPRRPQKEIIIK